MPARKIEGDGLPSNPDAERLILGSILVDQAKYASVASMIRSPGVFALDAHQQIWEAITDMAERGEPADRVTLANYLLNKGKLDSVGGLGYLISLDDGMPAISNIDGYVRIVIEKWRLRRQILVLRNGVNKAMSGDEDSASVSRYVQGAFTEDIAGFTASQPQTIAEYVSGYEGGINRLLDPSRREKGVQTGFSVLDEWTDGLHRSEIFIIGARPGTGKTAMAMNIARTVAQTGTNVAFFSLEMTKEQLLDRLICEEAKIDVTRFRRGRLSTEDRISLRRALDVIQALPIILDEDTPATVADIRIKVTRLQQKIPIGLMVIDYAQLIRARAKKYSTDNEKFEEIGVDIQSMAKNTGVPILLLSQLTRESEKTTGDNKPRLSQCRGSGVWEQIANVGACIYREYLRKRERDDLRDVAELIVEKNRTGRGGTIRLKYTDWRMKFEDAPLS